MQLSFEYRMRSVFDCEITDHHFSLMCIPQDTARQKIKEYSLKISPCSYQNTDKDFFGNKYVYGEALQKHTAFDVLLTGRASTGLEVFEDRDDRHNDIFLLQSKYTIPGKELIDFHNKTEYNIPQNSYEKAVGYMRLISQLMTYDKNATDISTDAEASFNKKRGVCQDYSHIILSLLRMSKIPARYAVGMLLGEGESHAWIEAYCNGYWYGFDATNNLLVNDNYIKLSHGRDFSDCVVSKGVFKNPSAENQHISVTVFQQ